MSAHILLESLLKNIKEIENCNCKLCVSLNEKIKEILNNDFHEVNKEDFDEISDKENKVPEVPHEEINLGIVIEKCGSGIIIKGADTVKIKEYLKKYKCLWNPTLKGWITFNNNKINVVKLLEYKKLKFSDFTD